MQISSNLPALHHANRWPHQQPQSRAGDAREQVPPAAATENRQNILAVTDAPTRSRFVMPANATSRTGQTALREYQSIQNEGGPELLNRVDVIV